MVLDNTVLIFPAWPVNQTQVSSPPGGKAATSHLAINALTRVVK